MFYERGHDGLPRRWIARMKNAIRTICPVFNTNRMVQEYTHRFYIPCAIRRNALRSDNRKRSIELTQWKQNVRAAWHEVRIEKVESGPRDRLPYGSVLQVSAEVQLGSLKPQDVLVEAYFGDIDRAMQIPHGNALPMEFAKDLGKGLYRFESGIPCAKTGQQAFTVRVLPHHADLSNKFELALITWA
jgi:glycogen phosphorylase